MGKPMSNTTERLVVNGEVVLISRDELSGEVARVAREQGVDHEVAWERVKSNITGFIENGEKPAGWKKSSDSPRGRRPESDIKDVPENTADPVFLFPEHPSEHIINAAVASGFEFSLSDDLLPEALRKTGISIQEAISRGLFTMEGEHPDAKLLRAAYDEVRDAEDKDRPVEDTPEIRMVRERQLNFPFKYSKKLRIMPSDFNQTSLFHVASNNTPRRFFKNEIMGKIGERVTLYFYGEELRHEDEAIFLQLVDIARGKAPGDWIYIENVPFIRGAHGITRKTSAKDSSSIETSLARMRGAYVTINRKNPKRGGKNFITVNLIKDLQGFGNDRRIMIDPCMVVLLTSYIAMDQDVLYKMKGVSRQLFKYISTMQFAGLYPTKVTSLYELCYGSLESLKKHYRLNNPAKSDDEVKRAMIKKVSDFRRKALPEALQDLKDRDLIVSYNFNEAEDKVAIVKYVPLAIADASAPGPSAGTCE